MVRVKWEQVRDLDEGKFKRIVGIKKETFRELVNQLKPKYEAKRKRGGRKPKLSLEDMIMATFGYLREYRTFASLGISFEIDETNIQRNIIWCENEMIKLDIFSLPGMKSLRSDKYKEVTIDVTECTIERPKKNQKSYYSGKKNDTH
jgi:hypothetical protein